MAKIIFGNMVTDARGKQGGMVYSRNRFGNYMRNKTSPVQPNTPAQQAARGVLSYLSQSYRGLTDTDRYLWAQASQDFPRVDSFGNKVYLTGAQLFNSLNSGLMETTGTTVVLPPSPQALSQFTVTSFVYDKALGTAKLNLDILNDNAADYMVAYMTAPISAGINYFKNRLVKLGTYAHADWTAGVLDISAEMLALFGYPVVGTTQPPAGTRFGFSLYTVNDVSGQKGIAQTIIGEVLT